MMAKPSAFEAVSLDSSQVKMNVIPDSTFFYEHQASAFPTPAEVSLELSTSNREITVAQCSIGPCLSSVPC